MIKTASEPATIAPLNCAIEPFFASQATEARRIFHGRGHLHLGLEHIVVDWFAPVVLVGLYAEFTAIDQLKDMLLASDKAGQIQSIVVQHRYIKGTPAELLWGVEVDTCQVVENGLHFEVRPGDKQNAGLFLDMRPLRKWLIDNSEDKNLLNLFAYTCSFSVAALAGSASGVTSVDMSKPSIRWGERNHKLNNQEIRRVRSIPHNLFKSWGKINQYGRYHTVIIDPPSRQRGSFDAQRNYAAVIKKLKQLTHRNADIFATLNSPFIEGRYLQQLFARYAPQCDFVEEFPASPEFEDKYPEKGLKIYRYKSNWGGK